MLTSALLRIVGLTTIAIATTRCSEPKTGPRSESPQSIHPAQAAAVTDVASPSSLAWHERARTLVGANRLSPLAAGRVYAALSVAQYQAVMSIDGPDTDGELRANGVGSGGRSLLEARRGAVAGASVQVLSFFFPAAAASLEDLAQGQADATPGQVHPEFARGMVAGRTAGDVIVQRCKTDGFTKPWDGSVRTGPGVWIPSGTPAGATFGQVRPYLLTSGAQFRPAPPPTFGSQAFLTDLGEIRALSDGRTAQQRASAIDWDYPTGTSTPLGYWNGVAADYITSHTLDELGATHALALMHASMMDALIGCWDAKYEYWTMRPSQADPAISLTFGLPNHPSYPSGHSCISAAAATVLSYVFPDRTAQLAAWVTDAGLSRMYAGIHYRFDITAGRTLGESVARWAIGRDQDQGLLNSLR
jgi:hypothetical protein